MRIIKRNGSEVEFDPKKISSAIEKANKEVEPTARLSERWIQAITEDVVEQCEESPSTVSVEEVQDMVQNCLIKHGAAVVATKYITYRFTRALARKANTTDDEILSLIELTNEEAKAENANKNPVIVSTQRDYMAGAVSKDLTNRVLLPKEIVDAHNAGIIHFHDSDYYSQHMHNCDVWNLEDMLQNGTVISNTLIEKPHSFYTACNITTQLVAQVASSQYGGQTFTLSHLAPFVDVSRQHLRKEVAKEFKQNGLDVSEKAINNIAENRLRDEITRGVQTIQYQLITLMTTNGQAPFVSIFMYLDEVEEGQLRDDLALIIEEVLKQRIQGVKNEKGVWITPAFPKLLYVTDEDNIKKDSKYFYLTELAAKCTAKRMVPDYISAKKMKELKNGNVYGCMGKRQLSSCKTF